VGRKETPFNNPFAALGKTLKKELEEKQKPPPPPPKPKPQPKVEEKSDEATFQDAMRGIDRLDGDRRGRAEAPPPPDANDLPLYDEDAEALAELVNLVDGKAKFDISDSDEFIEGAISGLDRRVLSSLRRGDFAVRAHLDLHGMTRDVARDAVEAFVLKARRENLRCVLIVHGRGLNSKDKIPVLKGALHNWLERGKIGRSVLAFCTARPHDGGAGAVYVLLRRSRDK
jgi:DNA-nicking Smr family endonuclease